MLLLTLLLMLLLRQAEGCCDFLSHDRMRGIHTVTPIKEIKNVGAARMRLAPSIVKPRPPPPVDLLPPCPNFTPQYLSGWADKLHLLLA